MGFQIKFNWVLQMDCKNELRLDKEYCFSKTGNRIFPIKTPIDLIDFHRTAIAKIVFLEFSNTENKTAGRYKVLKIYSGDEKIFLSNYWMENQ